MLRDDDATVAMLRAMRWHGRRAIDSSADAPGRLSPAFWPTVDEARSMTWRCWATFHPGEILTPIPLDPFTPDPCLTHFLAVVARECRSLKSGQNLSSAPARETEP